MSDNIDKMEQMLETLKANKKSREMAEEAAKLLEPKYKQALSNILNTEDGMIVFKVILANLGVFKYTKNVNPAMSMVNEVKRNVYLELIRPYLTKSIKSKLEE